MRPRTHRKQRENAYVLLCELSALCIEVRTWTPLACSSCCSPAHFWQLEFCKRPATTRCGKPKTSTWTRARATTPTQVLPRPGVEVAREGQRHSVSSWGPHPVTLRFRVEWTTLAQRLGHRAISHHHRYVWRRSEAGDSRQRTGGGRCPAPEPGVLGNPVPRDYEYRRCSCNSPRSAPLGRELWRRASHLHSLANHPRR